MASLDKHKDSTEARDAMARDFAQLRDDFKALRGDIAALAASSAKETKSSVKDGLANAESQAEKAYETATSELHEIQKQTEKAIRKSPISTVGAALAIGYFLGGVLARRN